MKQARASSIKAAEASSERVMSAVSVWNKSEEPYSKHFITSLWSGPQTVTAVCLNFSLWLHVVCFRSPQTKWATPRWKYLGLPPRISANQSGRESRRRTRCSTPKQPCSCRTRSRSTWRGRSGAKMDPRSPWRPRMERWVCCVIYRENV